MSRRPVDLSPQASPEVVLPPEPAEALEALQDALAVEDRAERRTAVAAVVADRPTFLDAWAALGALGRDAVESYAAARVGYHRGLDALRRNGWRGTGAVRWAHPENRGFLRCVAQLGEAAARIGEDDEAERCAVFLQQLDPEWSSVDPTR